MPLHDWTRVDSGIFHHFLHAWIDEISRALNRGLLPKDCYAVAEQIAGGLGLDVLTLRGPKPNAGPDEPLGGVALATNPPQVQYRVRAESDLYAAKAKAVVIRHKSGHRVLAVAEIVSPGNKSDRHAVRAFVRKALEMLHAGVHLLVVDVFPPGPRDPQGLHKLIWDELAEADFSLPPDRQLTIASYLADDFPEAFVEFAALGDPLPEMPLFLTNEAYIQAPLEVAYMSAWEAVPAYWREVIEGSAA